MSNSSTPLCQHFFIPQNRSEGKKVHSGPKSQLYQSCVLILLLIFRERDILGTDVGSKRDGVPGEARLGRVQWFSKKLRDRTDTKQFCSM